MVRLPVVDLMLTIYVASTAMGVAVFIGTFLEYDNVCTFDGDEATIFYSSL